MRYICFLVEILGSSDRKDNRFCICYEKDVFNELFFFLNYLIYYCLYVVLFYDFGENITNF